MEQSTGKAQALTHFTFMIEEQCNERSKLQDVAQEEVDEDLAVIATQLAYTYQVQGRTKEALTIYQDVVNSK